MAREEIRYYCDICGEFWTKKEKAEECEKSHLIPEKVCSAEYLKQDKKKEYPNSILINFKGGKQARYYREQKY